MIVLKVDYVLADKRMAENKEKRGDALFWWLTGMMMGLSIGFVSGMVAVCLMLEALGGG